MPTPSTSSSTSDPEPSTSYSTSDPTPSTSSSTGDTRLLHLPIPQDQMILLSMALVHLLSLPLVFVYFLHILRLKIKNKTMITRQLSMRKKHDQPLSDVICFKKNIYNK